MRHESGDQQRNRSRGEESAEAARRPPYEPPFIRELGNVQDLTRVGVSVGSVEAPEEVV